MRGAAAFCVIVSLGIPAQASVELGPVSQPPAVVANVDGTDQPAPTLADVLALGTDSPGRMTVPVTIGEGGPFQFTIDTGSERTVLSRQLAAVLNLAPGPGVWVTAMTGRSNVKTAVVPSIAISKLSATSIEAPVFDGYDLGAPGLVGIDALKGHALTIDFDKQQMSIVRSTKARRNEPSRPDEIVVQARSLLGQLVVSDASFRGRRVRVVLDTGASVSMGNRALQRLVARNRKTPQRISLTSVTGQTLVADYAVMDALTLGSATIATLPVAFSDAAPFERLGLTSQPALLLGMDALRLFRRVDIDFANRQVRLALPRTSFAQL